MGILAEVDLTGVIDLHMHTAPDVVPRRCTDLVAARTAAEAGMRAILIKSHHAPTAGRAALAEEATRGAVRVFGGLVLNRAVGGLNPCAADAALKLGAREIWMPTRDAANELRREGRPGGLSPLDERGRPLPAVYDIVDLVREADAILGTGHLSVAETVAVVRLARERGLRKVLVTHPEAPFIDLDPATQEALRDAGALFERCFVFATAFTGALVGLEQIAAQIRAVGVESTVLATDFGQAVNPPPAEGMRAYLAGLARLGFSADELGRMATRNPADLLGL